MGSDKLAGLTLAGIHILRCQVVGVDDHRNPILDILNF